MSGMSRVPHHGRIDLLRRTMPRHSRHTESASSVVNRHEISEGEGHGDLSRHRPPEVRKGRDSARRGRGKRGWTIVARRGDGEVEGAGGIIGGFGQGGLMEVFRTCRVETWLSKANQEYFSDPGGKSSAAGVPVLKFIRKSQSR
jgi:hypothetical protein